MFAESQKSCVKEKRTKETVHITAKWEKKWRNMKIGEALYQLKTENSFKYISIDNTSLSFADCIEMPSADAKAALELCLCVYVEKKWLLLLGAEWKSFGKRMQTNAKNQRIKFTAKGLYVDAMPNSITSCTKI